MAQKFTVLFDLDGTLIDTAPDDENEIIQPAKQGLLRALKSSIKNNVKRFVMTSSFSAVGYGHDKEVFDDLERVAKNLKIESSKSNELINGLKKRIHNVKIKSSKLNNIKQKKPQL